jgi:hypothetical protein
MTQHTQGEPWSFWDLIDTMFEKFTHISFVCQKTKLEKVLGKNLSFLINTRVVLDITCFMSYVQRANEACKRNCLNNRCSS